MISQQIIPSSLTQKILDEKYNLEESKSLWKDIFIIFLFFIKTDAHWQVGVRTAEP